MTNLVGCWTEKIYTRHFSSYFSKAEVIVGQASCHSCFGKSPAMFHLASHCPSVETGHLHIGFGFQNVLFDLSFWKWLSDSVAEEASGVLLLVLQILLWLCMGWAEGQQCTLLLVSWQNIWSLLYQPQAQKRWWIGYAVCMLHAW